MGKNFEFRLSLRAPDRPRSFVFILREDGWTVGDVMWRQDFDGQGPPVLPETPGTEPIVLLDSTRQKLADLHANRDQLTDRVVQIRLSTIATAVSERLMGQLL